MRPVARAVEALVAVLALSGASETGAQEPESEPTGALRVFLDCGFQCDFDYLRREVTFVNYVRDRQDAQVHVLVTVRESGGGEEWTFAFIGLEEFGGQEITLEYNTSDTDTEDEVREGYTQVIRIGLLTYLADSPLATEVTIEHDPGAGLDVAMATAEEDPWNFWVFEAELSSEFEGEQRARDQSIEGSFEANRTTEEWIVNMEVDGDFSEETFELNDGSVVVSDSRDWSVAGEVVRSLGPQWGASVRASAEASTFRNEELLIATAPGIEYNVFPYEESSRRLLTLTYEAGYARSRYDVETLFDVTEESLFDHLLLVRYAVTQPWGEASAAGAFSQFLNHPDQYRAELFGNLEVRITRGLSLELSAEYSRVRDQRFLPKEGITDEEVLLEQRALATDYEYEAEIGFSYTFGSIFNNVVNPRFEGRRGGGGFF